jgi:HSP20 family molecular chaperone IbpA
MNNSCCTTPNGTTASDRRPEPGYTRPAVDITEREDAFTLAADVPGASAEQIDVSVDKGVLTISAGIEPSTHGNARRLRAEFNATPHRRSFRLGEGIDVERITAECRDGVVTVRLPKTAATQARKIAVRAG